MITANQRKALKKILGIDYAKGVLEILRKRNVFNRNGEPYTSGSVRNVFAGSQENKEIEKAIYDLAIEKKYKEEELEEKRKQLLNNK